MSSGEGALLIVVAGIVCALIIWAIGELTQ